MKQNETKLNFKEDKWKKDDTSIYRSGILELP